eukprot:COSAG02_NODE_348_length_24081_cov_19.231007_8_plen_95_part_00
MTFLDTHIGAEILEMVVGGASVACVVIRTQTEDTRVLDILVREAVRGKGCECKNQGASMWLRTGHLVPMYRVRVVLLYGTYTVPYTCRNYYVLY